MAPLSAFQQAHEEHRYNLLLLNQHRLAEGLIYDERASEEALAAMAAMNPNYVAEQRVIYDDVRTQTVARQEVATMEVQLLEIAEENNTICTSYASLTNHRSARTIIFIVDLTSTGDKQVADCSEDE
ncbi:Hydroxymethylglutaryl-CoA lyase, mitochondrial [Hordeum vulgare]|nr:Hydroxymethylglutaryl-CoA lyase, mitochondrial [Hordeum vulgare]